MLNDVRPEKRQHRQIAAASIETLIKLAFACDGAVHSERRASKVGESKKDSFIPMLNHYILHNLVLVAERPLVVHERPSRVG